MLFEEFMFTEIQYESFLGSVFLGMLAVLGIRYHLYLLRFVGNLDKQICELEKGVAMD